MTPQRLRKCIVHIGTEKTGTTSLQKFLGTNRDALLQRGFLVSSSLSPYPIMANHERLTTIALNPAKLGDGLRVRAGLKTVEDVAEWRVRVEEELSREVEAISHQPEGVPTLLLSNEHCHSRLVTREEVHYLREFFDKFADETHIIVYLRPQHELAISSYSTILRVGFHDIEVFPDFIEGRSKGFNRLYFQYDKLLERWAGEFGRDKITVRLYSQDHFEGDDVIQDFMSVIGCNMDGLQVPANENVGLSAEHQAVLNAINRYIASQSGLAVTSLQRHKIVTALQAMSLASGGSGNRIKREDAIRFFHNYDDCNERVRKDYFPNVNSLFHPDFSAFPVDDPQPINEIDAAVRVILNLL